MKNSGAPSPCETFSNGEVEDYTVDFGNAPSVMVKITNFDLNIYPNPTNELLNIDITSANETVNVKIYNSIGQIIDNFDVKNKNTQIDLSSYSKGLYFIGIDNGEQNMLKKFIKN